MHTTYHLRLARPGEGLLLNAIEDTAGHLFDGLGLTDEALDHTYPLADLELLIRAGMVWVACDADDLPVGFIVVVLLDGEPHIDELDVHPDHQRRAASAARSSTPRAAGRMCMAGVPSPSRPSSRCRGTGRTTRDSGSRPSRTGTGRLRCTRFAPPRPAGACASTPASSCAPTSDHPRSLRCRARSA
jgi:hypothetical protein